MTVNLPACQAIQVSLEGGKYTFYVDESCEVGCKRYGEHWTVYPVGSKALLSLIHECAAQRIVNIQLLETIARMQAPPLPTIDSEAE